MGALVTLSRHLSFPMGRLDGATGRFTLPWRRFGYSLAERGRGGRGAGGGFHRHYHYQIRF